MGQEILSEISPNANKISLLSISLPFNLSIKANSFETLARKTTQTSIELENRLKHMTKPGEKKL